MGSISPAFQCFVLAYSSLSLTIFFGMYRTYLMTGEPEFFSNNIKAIVAVLAAPAFLALAMFLTLLKKPVIMVLNRVILPILNKRLERKRLALIKTKMKQVK